MNICFKKKITIISRFFSLVIINTNILSNFEKKWCTYDKENGYLKIKIKIKISQML
jgi:hypothetical protein